MDPGKESQCALPPPGLRARAGRRHASWCQGSRVPPGQDCCRDGAGSCSTGGWCRNAATSTRLPGGSRVQFATHTLSAHTSARRQRQASGVTAFERLTRPFLATAGYQDGHATGTRSETQFDGQITKGPGIYMAVARCTKAFATRLCSGSSPEMLWTVRKEISPASCFAVRFVSGPDHRVHAARALPLSICDTVFFSIMGEQS